MSVSRKKTSLISIKQWNKKTEDIDNVDEKYLVNNISNLLLNIYDSTTTNSRLLAFYNLADACCAATIIIPYQRHCLTIKNHSLSLI